MCGIAGVRRFDGAPVAPELLRRMAAQLRHRGPDDEGYWVDGSVGFGHRRLSIIDVAGSPQPMASHDGLLRVCFNGEIFNYRELRSRLRYPFRTSGDTEVLVAQHAERGPGGVVDLRGQFAYAIYDAADGDLWLARDRVGVLPLYYYLDDELIAFASEVKALFPAMPRGPQVDVDRLGDYLAHRAVPAPNTLFAGIRKLPPAHQLRVTANGRAIMRRYWSLPGARDVLEVTPAEAVDGVASRLQDAVDAALVADVPVGAYLSGGVDSSLISAIARTRHGSAGLDTFSAGFDDPRVDELPFARQVSALLETRHHEVTVRAEDFSGAWERLTWHRDAPISEPADVAVHALASLARRHVKVVLSGEGSDELFAGYPKYRYARLASAADVVPSRWRPALFTAFERTLPAAARRPRIALRSMATRDEAERFRSWFAPFTQPERARLLGAPWAGSPDDSTAYGGDVVRRMLVDGMQSWLPDNLLERGDRMSMAASLELRPPFLDHRLVEYAFQLPSDVKVRKATTKWVVKEVARRYLPDSIVDRPKAGFRVPLDAWFRGDLRDLAHDRLLARDAFVTTVFARDAVRTVLDDHDRGRRNEDIRIWTLLCLEVWHDVFFTRARHMGQTGKPERPRVGPRGGG